MTHDLAFSMLHRFSRGWRIVFAGDDWWWTRAPICAADNQPPMALDADELALWNQLRQPKGPR